MQIVALCGSIRKKSLNRMLLQALADRAPDGVKVSVVGIEGIPVYDGDLEASGMPAAVTALQDRIAAADALILGSPEYNGGVPGPLKNAIDWCSRGGRMDEVFAGRPTGLVGATPGPGGTRHAQQAWLQTFRVLGVEPWLAGQLYVNGAGSLFGEDGALTDEATAKRCVKYMQGFTAFVRSREG